MSKLLFKLRAFKAMGETVLFAEGQTQVVEVTAHREVQTLNHQLKAGDEQYQKLLGKSAEAEEDRSRALKALQQDCQDVPGTQLKVIEATTQRMMAEIAMRERGNLLARKHEAESRPKDFRSNVADGQSSGAIQR